MPKKQNSLGRVESELRKLAFGLPGAHEDFPWGESVAKVGKKVFVFFGQPNRGGGFAFSVKLPTSGADALDLLKQWIKKSYRSAAPKKLLTELDRSGG